MKEYLSNTTILSSALHDKKILSSKQVWTVKFVNLPSVESNTDLWIIYFHTEKVGTGKEKFISFTRDTITFFFLQAILNELLLSRTLGRYHTKTYFTLKFNKRHNGDIYVTLNWILCPPTRIVFLPCICQKYLKNMSDCNMIWEIGI